MPTYQDDFNRSDSSSLPSTGWANRDSTSSIASNPVRWVGIGGAEFCDVSVSVAGNGGEGKVMTPQGWIELGEVCPNCRQRWDRGDVAITRGGQPFKHTDCDDPKLENDVE